MLFNSLEFWAFFAACFAALALLPHRAQNRLLLLASYLFYASWDWRFLSLIWLSTGVDYWVGQRLASSDDTRVRRRWLALSLTTNLGLLGFFKYAGFFADSAVELAAAFDVVLPPLALTVLLPVGISFYTFQTLSYTFDIYRGRLTPSRSLLDFALFVAFFPQLVAGPIERASRLLPQVAQRRRITWERIGSGGWLALWGLFKKVVIADNLAHLVDAAYAGSATTNLEMLLAFYAFALQIYCDFSGYTDIARGIARAMGFDLMLNFDRPYWSASPAEFWRRWHISLSSWLRDYLYISLGGNRRGRRRTYLNLLATMLLGGLWHGAAWTFVVWGAYHGLLLALHRALAARLAPLSQGALRWPYRALAVAVTFHLVCVGWVFFRAESLGQAVACLQLLLTLGSPEPGVAGRWLLPFATLAAPLVVFELLQRLQRSDEVLPAWPLPLRSAGYAALLLAIVLLGDQKGQPFVYFQF